MGYVLLMAFALELQPLHLFRLGPESCELSPIDNLALIPVSVDELGAIAGDFELRSRCLFRRSVQGDLKVGNVGVEESKEVARQSSIHNLELLGPLRPSGKDAVYE